MFFSFWVRAVKEFGEDASWQILSENDVVLKTWNYSDYGLPNQQFFEESSWHYSQIPGRSAFVTTEFLWTFDIRPEDITPD